MKKIHPDDETWRHGWMGLVVHVLVMMLLILGPWVLVVAL